MEWLVNHKLPIGNWMDKAVDWLTTYLGWFFDSIAFSMQIIINTLIWLLQTPHPFIIIAIFALLAYLLQNSLKLTVAVILSCLLIINFDLWYETTETLVLVISSAFICMGFGVPLGIICARKPKFYTFLRPVLDLMQTIPTFVYLIPALILFGLGAVPGLFATVIFAIPAPIRLTYLGISSTPVSLIEAGEVFGATKKQLLWKVQIPYAMPQIKAGLTQTIMLSLSMVVIAALVGADGLGVTTLRALNQVNIAKGFEVGIAIVLVAIMLDRVLNRSENAAIKPNPLLMKCKQLFQKMRHLKMRGIS
ncbi:MAG: choline ABC transporter permease subunit [Alphaproteobacteria bacterium]|nr:choline ABC transporter permease subunit [Alphaproteobacteria bacterium]